jgi:hypothetical protein
MNYADAFEIFEIDLNIVDYNDISLEYLTKKYRKLALKNHPDKNGNTLDSNEKFKKINEAYNFLKKEMKHLNSKDFDTELDTETDYDANSSLYADILRSFMKSVFERKYNELLSKIVNDIIIAGKQISIKIFDDLDKETTTTIYTFLSNNRSVLHLNQEILDAIREIVLKKYDNVQVYKLNPSIDDLLNNNLYKLYVNNTLFLVPLWYNESCFDNSGCEIVVICEPELPQGVELDEDNNIFIKLTIHHNDLFKLINDGLLNFKLGEKNYDILLSNLHMKREQFYKIKNEGISKVKKDIYDISEKSDIIVKITII